MSTISSAGSTHFDLLLEAQHGCFTQSRFILTPHTFKLRAKTRWVNTTCLTFYIWLDSGLVAPAAQVNCPVIAPAMTRGFVASAGATPAQHWYTVYLAQPIAITRGDRLSEFKPLTECSTLMPLFSCSLHTLNMTVTQHEKKQPSHNLYLLTNSMKWLFLVADALLCTCARSLSTVLCFRIVNKFSGSIQRTL